MTVMQQEEADDYVLATGEMHSVREFVEKSFAIVGITIQWDGHGIDEVGLNAQTGKIIVRIDGKCFIKLSAGGKELNFILAMYSLIFPAS